MNRREEEELIQNFIKMSDLNKTVALAVTALMEVGVVEDLAQRKKIIEAAMTLYRVEIVFSFATFVLGSKEDADIMLAGAIQEIIGGRRQRARETFGQICCDQLHWGETLQ